MPTPLGKDLTALEYLSADQIRLILDTAEPFKEVSERQIKKVPALRGKTIVNLFFEASTRTRISFEFAEKRLSADTVNVASSGSSVSKGETLVDTARNLEAMHIDMVVIRHHASGSAEFLGQADPLQRHQRRRREARAPDPGAARHPDAARQVREDRGPQGGHLRRPAPQPGGPEQHPRPAEARRRGGGVRPGVAAAARRGVAGRHGHSAHRGRDPVGRRPQHPAPAAGADDGGLHPLAPGIQPRVRPHARRAWTRRRRTW